MKSPITNKEMPLLKRLQDLVFRKEVFSIIFHYYHCQDSGEEFTDDQLDEINQTQVYNKYRERYGIPFPDAITAIREQYELNPTRMSLVLGLGSNTYRLYESGEMPSVANGRLILSVKEPDVFARQVEASSHFLSGKEQHKLLEIVKKLKEKELHNQWNQLLEKQIFSDRCPSEYNGYRSPQTEKIAEIISYFSPKIDLYKTKLNKLLFYCDFSMFKHTAYSMTGITYKAIPYGPVPVEYDKLYMKLCDEGRINILPQLFKDGNYGELIQSATPCKHAFSDLEEEVLASVLNKFKGKTTKQVVDISHEETAWLDNHQDKNLISYQKYAFDIKAI